MKDQKLGRKPFIISHFIFLIWEIKQTAISRQQTAESKEQRAIAIQPHYDYRCLLFTVCYFTLAIYCLLFTVCCLLFTVCCLLFTVCYLLFAVCCLLFALFPMTNGKYEI